MTKRGLGKGLDALFQSYEEEAQKKGENQEGISEIKIHDIDPNKDQPRKDFDDKAIGDLVNSIKEHGIVQPILLKPNNGRYTIIAGERRWRAARAAGFEKIPAIIRDVDKNQMLMIALVENLQREDLNPIEEAEAIKLLVEECNLTQEQASQKIGKSRPVIANSLRLLTLSVNIQSYLRDNKLTTGHARALLGIEDLEKREKVAQQIIENELSVRETERLINRLKEDSQRKHKKLPEKPGYIVEIESRLEESLGTKVSVTQGKKKGTIEIEYYNNDDLERIMNRII